MKRYALLKNGKRVLLRQPRFSDAEALMRFVNGIVKEGARIELMKPVSINEEKKYLKSVLKAIRKGKRADVLAEYEGKIVGRCDIIKNPPFPNHSEHVGTMGLMVANGFRGLGLGKILMSETMKEAKKIGIKIVRLWVIEDNKVAIRLYKKMGFKIYGKIPKGYKVGRQYLDKILMVREI